MLARVNLQRSFALKRLLVAAALSAASGCANTNIRWIEGAPAAPGSGMRAEPALQAGASAPVRSDGDPNPDALPPPPFEPEQRQRITLVEPWVQQAARSHALDPALIHAVIWVESRHQPRAKSPAGARGLMQLMPATANAMARQMGESRARVYDPEFNIMAGSRYLAAQAKRYEGDWRLALAAYNAGAGNVNRWLAEDGDLPPNSQRYVELVMDAKRRFDARANPPPASRPAQTMVAQAPPRAARVPEPPPPAAEEGVYYDEELGAIPRYVVVPPEPGATETPPPPEPPLRDTPYPPNDEEVFGASGRRGSVGEKATAADPQPGSASDAHDHAGPPNRLPGVLD